MVRFRRLAALVMTILLLPAQVLAAMPIHHCMAPGGHNALEFIIEGVAHGGDHASHGPQESASGVFHAPACVDTELFDAASHFTSDLQPVAFAIKTEMPAVIAPVLTHLSIAPTAYRRGRTDPGLMMRRTVVLRH